MSGRMIENHPLDGMDVDLFIDDILNRDSLSDDEKRNVAECRLAKIDESSDLNECVYVLSRMIAVHIPQFNAILKDNVKSQYYSNPIELIREESKRRANKKIWYTGNIADAHKRYNNLKSEIVSEETPKQMSKTVFWSVLFGAAFLALAIYSCFTGAAVDAMTWMISSNWFKIIFILVTLGLSLYFGFFSIGVLLVGGLLIVAWIILSWPGVASFIVNGLLFVIAAVLILVAYTYIESIIKYKPLSPEAHERNQSLISEKEALAAEINEYGDLMLSKLGIIKKVFTDKETEFLKSMKTYITGSYDTGTIYEMFSFLNKYYNKMKR